MMGLVAAQHAGNEAGEERGAEHGQEVLNRPGRGPFEFCSERLRLAFMKVAKEVRKNLLPRGCEVSS